MRCRRHVPTCAGARPILVDSQNSWRLRDGIVVTETYANSADRFKTSYATWFVIVGIFVLAAFASAQRKPITQGFDELAHVSYVAQRQADESLWVNLEDLRMLAPQNFKFTETASYLNHPPFYYDLMAAIGPTLQGRVPALMVHRSINIAIVALALIATFAWMQKLNLSRMGFYAVVIPTVATPVLAPLAGSVNNDNLAFAGGALTLFGAFGYLTTERRGWLVCTCAGVAVASAAKVTGLMLAGGLLGGLVLWLALRRRMSSADIAIVLGALALCSLPYLLFFLEYGSPTPNTPAQAALLRDGAEGAGWSQQGRMNLPRYITFFIGSFVSDWMPALAQRSVLNVAALALPVASIVLAFGGWFISVLRLIQGRANEVDAIVVFGLAAAAVTFTIHLAFSYQRHLATGWMMDAYPRYYLPIVPVVALAAMWFTCAIRNERLRSVVTGFLVVSPFAFFVLGSPL